MIDLRYPILLVHGMGFRDYKHVGYWGRIPKALERKGCTVYTKFPLNTLISIAENSA